MSGKQGGRVATGWAGTALLAGAVLVGCGTTPSTPTGSAATGGAATGGAVSTPTEVLPAGDIPDTQVYVPFSPAGGGFTVSVPQGWAQSGQGTATVFTDKFNSVRIERAAMGTAPDVTTVKAQDVPRLQGSVAGFALTGVQTVPRTAGTAVLVTYEAMSAANSVTGKSVREAVERYSFWHSGQEVVLTLSAPKGADDVDPWRKITDSLRWQA